MFKGYIMICEYAINKCTVMVKRLDCKLCNDGCGMWRWCIEKQQPLMSNNYFKYGCPIKKKFEQKVGD